MKNTIALGNEEKSFYLNDSFNIEDLEKLENILNEEIEENIAELEVLKREEKKIGTPEALGETVMNVIWEQVNNQIAATAGEDFIKSNNNMTLDLSNDAHIQTTENFAKKDNPILATHNQEVNYKERHDIWIDSFQKDENGKIKTQYDRRSNSEKEVLKKSTRKDFDRSRDKGSASMHKDHTIPVAEIIRDPAANAHLSREEQIAFANSDVNLNDLDAAANMSKSDSTVDEWLNSERNGEKPAERFNIDEKDLRKKDKKARKAYKKLKEDAEKRAYESGRRSQINEAKRIAKTSLREAVMQLLLDLLKDVIKKFISWLKNGKKTIAELLNYLKSAISEFIGNLKNHIMNTVESVATTILTSIYGPIVRLFKKAWTLLKQGWSSLKQAYNYIRSDEAKSKPISIIIMEVSKIIVAGLSAGGAMLIGEVIEKSLMGIPVFAIEIPLLGSLASIIGIFMGALVSGIIGAIAINLIDKLITKKLKNNNIVRQIETGSKVLNLQSQLYEVKKQKKEHIKEECASAVNNRHEEASEIIIDSLTQIQKNEERIKQMKNNKSKDERDDGIDNDKCFNNLLKTLSDV